MTSLLPRVAVGVACLALLSCAGWLPGRSVELPLEARVVRISEEFANINTDLSGKRLAAAGIETGSIFLARHGDRDLRVTLGEGYGDVERGDWVGLIEEDGNLQIAVSFGHAATELGCAVGDTLFIRPAAAP